MKSKSTKLFQNASEESLEVKGKKSSNASSVDCTIKKKNNPKVYANYSLSESILFNSK